MLLQTSAPVCPLVTEPETETPISWYSVCQINYTRDTWVKLIQPPSYFSYDRAKLLCEASEASWVAWVPNYGGVLLDRSHFYC